MNIFVLCAGQGVVLERCVYSDFVFLETMHNAGYVSKGGEYLSRNLALDWMIMEGRGTSPSSTAGCCKLYATQCQGTSSQYAISSSTLAAGTIS
jgi:hypothetical protein